MRKLIPFSFVLSVFFVSTAAVWSQSILESKSILAASATTAEYKMTLLPGNYSATVRSSDLRPIVELLDNAENVLFTEESSSRTFPVTVAMKFIVNRAHVFTLRIRSESPFPSDRRYQVILTRVPDAPPPNKIEAPDGAPSSNEQQVVDLVNQERRKMGLSLLRVSGTLAQAARRHSANMARQDTGAHELDGVGPGERIKEAGYRAMQWGENIAWGARTPEQAMSGWMNSPGHRRNILSSDVSEIGVGIAESSTGVLYWTQVSAGRWSRLGCYFVRARLWLDIGLSGHTQFSTRWIVARCVSFSSDGCATEWCDV